MKGKKSGAAGIFIGALLIVVFAVGLIASRDPGAFLQSRRYDYAMESFVAFCVNCWLPAGIIGIPLFLVSLLLSLARENRENR